MFDHATHMDPANRMTQDYPTGQSLSGSTARLLHDRLMSPLPRRLTELSWRCQDSLESWEGRDCPGLAPGQRDSERFGGPFLSIYSGMPFKGWPFACLAPGPLERNQAIRFVTKEKLYYDV